MPADVDFRIMLTFIEFYTTLTGFVNFKLFNTVNLHYPPKVTVTTYSNCEVPAHATCFHITFIASTIISKKANNQVVEHSCFNKILRSESV
jgi:hypothetical protein